MHYRNRKGDRKMPDTGGRVVTSNFADSMLMRVWDASSMRWPRSGFSGSVRAVPVASLDNNEGVR